VKKNYIDDNEFKPDDQVFTSEDNEKIKFEFDDFGYRKQMSVRLQDDPNVIIIDPFLDNNSPEYTIEELGDKYSNFMALNAKYKRFSNYYSLQLWGYDVNNMYNIMKNLISPNEDKVEDSVETVEESFTNINDDNIQPTLDNVLEMSMEDDKLGLIREKLKILDRSDLYKKAVCESNTDYIDNYITDDKLLQDLPSVVPYFTPDEMDDLNIVNDIKVDPEIYGNTVSEKMKAYNAETDKDRKKILESEILSLGWNPSVAFTEKNIRFAQKKQEKWLAEHTFNIIDLTKLKFKPITESFERNDKIYDEKGLYPIYIVCSHPKAFSSKVIVAVTKSKYSHAGLSLDSSLNNIATFKYEFKKYSGFNFEGIKDYLDCSDDATICVLGLFVNKETHLKIENIINDFIKNQNKTKYAFGNCINILFNKVKESKDNLSLVCSQFVATVLKLADIKITDKTANLTIPQDFVTIANSNPRIYKVYEGYAKKYDSKKVDNIVRELLNDSDISELKYTNEMALLEDEYSIDSFRNKIIDNKEAEETLAIARDYLTPRAELVTVKPIISINSSDDLDTTISNITSEYKAYLDILNLDSAKNIKDIVEDSISKLYTLCLILDKLIEKSKSEVNCNKIYNLKSEISSTFLKYLRNYNKINPNFDFKTFYLIRFSNAKYNTSSTDSIIYTNNGELIKKLSELTI
jgi:hypothetical protein